jgi:hypothetical protein
MYDLPSGEADTAGTLVDLFDDEDLEMMWEELDVMLVGRGGAGRGAGRGGAVAGMCKQQTCASSRHSGPKELTNLGATIKSNRLQMTAAGLCSGARLS